MYKCPWRSAKITDTINLCIYIYMRTKAFPGADVSRGSTNADGTRVGEDSGLLDLNHQQTFGLETIRTPHSSGPSTLYLKYKHTRLCWNMVPDDGYPHLSSLVSERIKLSHGCSFTINPIDLTNQGPSTRRQTISRPRRHPKLQAYINLVLI